MTASDVLLEDWLTLLELLFFCAIAVLKGEAADEALLEGRKGLKNEALENWLRLLLGSGFLR
jgi:hypothetical protein